MSNATCQCGLEVLTGEPLHPRLGVGRVEQAYCFKCNTLLYWQDGVPMAQAMVERVTRDAAAEWIVDQALDEDVCARCGFWGVCHDEWRDADCKLQIIKAAYAAVGEQPPGPGATAADPATGLSQQDWERILPPESSAEAYAMLGKCCPKCGRTDLGLQHGSHQYRIAFSCRTCAYSWMEATLDAPVASTAGGDVPGPSAAGLRAELQAERTRADHAEQLAAQHDSQRKFAQCRADEAKGLLDALEGFHIFQKADPDDDTRTKWTSSWLVDNPLYPTLRDLANALLPAPANEEAPDAD